MSENIKNVFERHSKSIVSCQLGRPPVSMLIYTQIFDLSLPIIIHWIKKEWTCADLILLS